MKKAIVPDSIFTAVGPKLDSIEPLPGWVLLEETANRVPDRTAIIFDDFALSYAELLQLVRQIAAGLQSLHLRKNDCVGICMPNHPVAIVLYFAVSQIGATAVFLGTPYAHSTLTNQARDSGVKIVATLDREELRTKVRDIVANAGIEHVLVCPADPFGLARPSSLVCADNEIDLNALMTTGRSPSPVELDPVRDVAIIQYSGGTTGEPKGVILTHANLHASARLFAAAFPMLRFGSETFLAAAPLYHIAGSGGTLHPAVAWGATMLLIERFDAVAVASLCAQYNVSYMAAVPTMYFALAGVAESARVDWSCLKFAVSAGAPLPEAVKMRFESATGRALLQGYGLSECSPPVSLPVFEPATPATSCGKICAGTQVQVRSVTDPKLILPAGEVGEICVRGPQVTPGYWNRPDETDAAFIDGYFRTGDVGYVTEEGVLFLTDRLKDIIICSGYNVYPTRIEEAVYQHPAVAEAVVIGVPDEYRGETVKLFVVLRPGQTLSLEALREFLAPLLSPIEMPKQLEIRNSLPRSEVGKLSRRLLRTQLEEEARV